MNNWTKVIIASIFEVGWVIGMKHASTILEWGFTAIAIFLSFYLMILASKKLPVGTVYAVFVGLGTAGTVLSEIILFNEPIRWIKLLLIGLLLMGVVGLKVTTDQEEEAKGGNH